MASELAATAAVEKRLEVLHANQSAITKEQANRVDELRALQLKYALRYSELFHERGHIINTLAPPDAGETSAGIPGFWLMAMTRCRKIASYIREADEPVLEYLNNVVLEYLPEFTGFKLFFHFTPNPYFSDAVLSKTFEIPKMLVASMEAEVVSVPGCEIDWKPGMTLMKRISIAGRMGPSSFFEMFASPDLLVDPTTPEEAFQQRDHVTKALTIGYALKDKVIPYAVSFYDGTYVEELDDDEEEEQYGA